jgi:hypothetical protein|tara:strand:- start:162438 stop:162596 length:159 start_codon:yes stop_codon:yes gene_type:complete
MEDYGAFQKTLMSDPMTLSKTETRQSFYALLAAIPFTAVIIAATFALAEFAV